MKPAIFAASFLLVVASSAPQGSTGQEPVDPTSAAAGIGATVRTLLDASAELGALLERTEGLTKFPPPPAGADPWEEIGKRMAEVTPLLYPSRRAAAREARRALLQSGSDSVPAVLEELRACDLATYAGCARVGYGFAFLHELAGGGFGGASSLDVNEKSVAASRKALASWSDLWTQTAADRDFWNPAYGLDRAKAPRAVPGTALPFVDNELVMAPGTRIRVGNGEDALEIAAGAGFERTYTRKGVSRSVLMDPRLERWHRSLGMYCPGPGSHWAEHEGITRGVLEEGQMHFETTDEALAWLAEPKRWRQVAYRNDGLAVSWGRDPVTLYAEVWQVTIGGKRPTELPGSNDAAIVVTRTEASPTGATRADSAGG